MDYCDLLQAWLSAGQEAALLCLLRQKCCQRDPCSAVEDKAAATTAEGGFIK